jgi:hypothetical protein
MVAMRWFFGGDAVLCWGVSSAWVLFASFFVQQWFLVLVEQVILMDCCFERWRCCCSTMVLVMVCCSGEGLGGGSFSFWCFSSDWCIFLELDVFVLVWFLFLVFRLYMTPLSAL